MEGAFKLKHDNPKKKANILSKLFYTWTIPLFHTGTQRKIQLLDLYKALPEDKSEGLGDRLEYQWNKQVKNAREKPNRKPSLLVALIKTFFWEYSIYGVFFFLQHVVLRAPQPFVLSMFIGGFEATEQSRSLSTMYITASLLVAISLLTIFLWHHGNFGSMSVGMRIRIAVSSLIYRKIIKLNKTSQGQTAAGQIINILSNDVQRFDLVAPMLHFLWIMPIQVVLVTCLMWKIIGNYCFVGIAAMIVITIPLQTYLGKLTSHLRLKVATKCDTRVKHMSEIISGIQVIKMYAWEKPFEKLIQYLRANEVKSLTHSSYLRGFYASCMVFIERLTLFLTVIAYVLAGYPISADIVFSMAQFFNILQLALAIFFPMTVSLCAESWVAINRLEGILFLDEKELTFIEKVAEKGVNITDVTASWIPNVPILKNIDLKISEGQLCAVIGPVGAGKSSLLQLILEELPPSEGKIQLGGNISYSSQEPWLFAASVRKNILFGKPYDSTLYTAVAEVCALEKDFEQFPYGDKTMVGERGVSLSGGQRARINLARAIYRQADVYLMDDPISAVDTHVGKHLFEKCILTYLKGKTRILVTHQLQYLKKADLIIVLNEGRVEAKGTFEELSNSNLDFTKLLAAADESREEKEHRVVDEEVKKHDIRKMSTFSANGSLHDQTIKDNDDDETLEYKGSTPFRDYFKSVQSWCLVIFIMCLFFMSMVACTLTDYWAAFWTGQEHIRNPSTTTNENSSSHIVLLPDNDHDTNKSGYFTYQLDETKVPVKRFNLDNWFDNIEYEDGAVYRVLKTNVSIYIYTVLILLAIFFTVSRSIYFFVMAMRASRNIHSNMFHCLLKAPMRFFDTNPSGRILNRFSKDMGAIDEILPRVLLDAVQVLLVGAGILINVTISNYYMVIAMVVLGAVFLKIRQWFIASAKDIKHLEGIAKSPVFSHINSTLNGLTTIRAARAEKALIKEFDDHQNVHTSAWFFTIMCAVSFGLWLDIICVLFTFVVTFGFVIATQYGYVQNGSLVGLAISQSLILTGMLQFGMKQTAEVINQLTSVERVLHYTNLENEGPFETPKENLRDDWPQKGSIQFRNMNLAYARDEPPVLKDLNLKVESGEKIGIVGRTGAGKSSLIAALFRLAPIEGEVLIDGVDTKSLGLTELRKNIAIIPQEPVLFNATLRYNLDPFNQFEDTDLWQALEEVELKDVANSLEFQVSEGGSNFSLGQRQLLCLARALLRNNKILVLDEATANVDARTDSLIQRTIRNKFKDCTVMTIAHRLNTIMDSDKVLVMGSGRKLEYDHPHVLLQIHNSQFLKMVEETGKTMTQQLKDVALQAWMEKNFNIDRSIYSGTEL